MLSERGLEQAAALAAELDRRGQAITQVVSGTMARQRLTATSACERFGCDLRTDDRWDEYDHDEIISTYTDLTSAPKRPDEFHEVLERALLGWLADSSPKVTWADFSERANAALRDLAASLSSGETALVCTSGGPIAAVCLELLDLSPRSFVKFNRVLVNAGTTKVVVGRRGQTLVSFNEHSHLEGPDASLVTYR